MQLQNLCRYSSQCTSVKAVQNPRASARRYQARNCASLLDIFFETHPMLEIFFQYENSLFSQIFGTESFNLYFNFRFNIGKLLKIYSTFQDTNNILTGFQLLLVSAVASRGDCRPTNYDGFINYAKEPQLPAEARAQHSPRLLPNLTTHHFHISL